MAFISEVSAELKRAVISASPAFRSASSMALVSPKVSSMSESSSVTDKEESAVAGKLEPLTVTLPACRRIVSPVVPSATSSSFISRVKVAVPLPAPAAMGIPNAYPVGVPVAFDG